MKKIFFSLILFFSALSVSFAQNQGKHNQPTDTTPKKIEIRNSNSLEVTPVYGPDVKILRGNVEFFHDESFMYCDSAHYNTADNFFKAWGHVYMKRPYDKDTMRMWGDSLDYDGSTRYAKLRSNVKLTKDSMEMLTEFIDYNMAIAEAKYFNGGITFTDSDTLISDLGFFYPKTNDLVYNKDVVVKSPGYTMYSDTLTHNIKSKISSFQGPTRIIGDSNYIYSERGNYNHKLDKCTLTKNSYLISKEHKLIGDTIYYDRKQKMGSGRSRVQIIDTIQNIQLTGNYAKYYEEPELSMLTDSALMKYISKKDTMFVHADTLRSLTDTLFTDTDTTVYRVIKAYYHTKFFKSDLQGMCDSLVYNMLDSVVTMYQKPVLWQDNSQISSKTIKLYTVENRVDMAEFLSDAFILSKVDSLNRFNQISGNDMVAYLDSNKITEVEVIDNSQTIYFSVEDSVVTGMNIITGKNMDILFENGELNRIWFYENPKGKMFPLNQITPENMYLDGFIWYQKYRPMKWSDIFDWETVDIKKNELIKDNPENALDGGAEMFKADTE